MVLGNSAFEFLALLFSSSPITILPRTATVYWLSACAKTTMTLWLWLCIKNTKYVRERGDERKENAGLIKESTAGYPCSRRALEISLVALVTARTDSDECQWVHTNVFAVGAGQCASILSWCSRPWSSSLSVLQLTNIVPVPSRPSTHYFHLFSHALPLLMRIAPAQHL